MTGIGGKVRSQAPQTEEEKVSFEGVKDTFERIFKPQSLPFVEAQQLSANQELKQRRQFSKWVDAFLNRGGWEALSDLQSRHGVPYSHPAMVLTWWKMRDMEFERVPRGEEMKEKLQNREGREWIINKLQGRAKDPEECAGIITALRLTISFIPIPGKRGSLQFPPLPWWTMHDMQYREGRLNGAIKLAQDVARWIKDLPPPTPGPRLAFEKWHRAISLCGLFKGFTGKPLYALAFRILHCAFPQEFRIDEKTKLIGVKTIQRALRERGDGELPVTLVPAEVKGAATLVRGGGGPPSASVKNWFQSSSREVGSFLWICEFLDLQPKAVRDYVLSASSAKDSGANGSLPSRAFPNSMIHEKGLWEAVLKQAINDVG